jgi:hypothetical protein
MLLIITALASAGALAADAPPTSVSKSSMCFRPDEFLGWKAPNALTIYISLSRHRYYRLDLAAKCPELLEPDSHLNTRFDGTNMVCGALDWNIKVSGPVSPTETCIVKAMRPLSTAEAAAIPKEFRP